MGHWRRCTFRGVPFSYMKDDSNEIIFDLPRNTEEPLFFFLKEYYVGHTVWVSFMLGFTGFSLFLMEQHHTLCGDYTSTYFCCC